MIYIKNLNLVCSKAELAQIPEGKTLINTINAHSYNTALKDEFFAEALLKGDYLIPDGASIVKACHWLHAKSLPQERVAGWDLFSYEMNSLNEKGTRILGNPETQKLGNLGNQKLGNPETQKQETQKPVVMFMGSSEKVLKLIRERAKIDFPNLDVVTYSPPYKPEFSEEDNRAIIDAINYANPDLLWIGMTAPKQEKWTYGHWKELNIHCHVGTIGAVFDFYAGTVKRAPEWWQQHSLEWLYRLIKEPKRMWRRYIIGNTLFLWNILHE